MRSFVLPLLLLVEIAVLAPVSGIRFDSFGAFTSSFGYYASDLCAQAAPLLLLVFGMTVVLMTAGIDLSVGSAVALVACVMSTFDGQPTFWITAVPIGLAVGLVLGLFNGTLIARLEVPPIIATLGTLFFYRGLCEAVMRGQERGPFYDVVGYEWFGGLAGSLCTAGAVLLAGGWWFRRSRWRREVLMMGGNPVAARYAGIPVERRILQVYALMGALVFVAALCHTARNGSVTASSLVGLELQVIVAAVLGGTRVSGGAGSLSGSVYGVFLVAVLAEGLRSAGMYWGDTLPFEIRHLEFILLGGLLVLGVWLNTHAQRLPGLSKKLT